MEENNKNIMLLDVENGEVDSDVQVEQPKTEEPGGLVTGMDYGSNDSMDEGDASNHDKNDDEGAGSNGEWSGEIAEPETPNKPEESNKTETPNESKDEQKTEENKPENTPKPAPSQTGTTGNVASRPAQNPGVTNPATPNEESAGTDNGVEEETEVAEDETTETEDNVNDGSTTETAELISTTVELKEHDARAETMAHAATALTVVFAFLIGVIYVLMKGTRQEAKATKADDLEEVEAIAQAVEELISEEELAEKNETQAIVAEQPIKKTAKKTVKKTATKKTTTKKAVGKKTTKKSTAKKATTKKTTKK